MSLNSVSASRLEDPPSFPEESAAPDRGLGRYLRMFVGVRENVLDCVPTDRPRYTGLGIIVVNTGFLAALAMFTALDKVVTAPAPVLIVVALAWGWIILSIDRWLITSTHGLHGGGRFLVFAPRILLALLIALSIAEPLTLRIFQPSIDSQIHQDRNQALITYGSLLKMCNPASGVAVTSSRCAQYQLTVANSPTILQRELINAKGQEGQTQGQVNHIEARLGQLQTAARDECAGVAGAGLSGVGGVGFRCRHDYAAVTNYESSSGLAAKQRLLRSLQGSVAQLNIRLAAAKSSYSGAITRAIHRAVAAKRAGQGKIGLLDEWKALGELTSQSTLVAYGRWLLWLLLIALDCLPVLSKLMNGYTPYDRCLTRRVESDDRINDVDVRLREQQQTADKEVEIQVNDIRRQGLVRRATEDDRVSRAQLDAEMISSVERLAKQWIRESNSEDD